MAGRKTREILPGLFLNSITFDFEAKQDTARRYLMIASGLPNKIGAAVQARTP
jgi:hypothetical protein